MTGEHAALLSAAGFDLVGQVFGSTVMQIGWAGWSGCGWRPGYLGPAVLPPRSTGFAAYSSALRTGRFTALDRMRRQAVALGADGVVGVRLTEQPRDEQKREFTAVGAAVRSRGRQRPGTPFTTDLGPADVAKLLAAGWVPAGVVYGLEVAVRHDDWRTASSLGFLVGNTEMAGYTELLTHVRAQARRDFAGRVAALGADAALMSGLRSRTWAIEVGERHTDRAASCLMTGTAIARFRTGRRPVPAGLTVLPLRSSR
ncbi:hypothetical protein GCM10010168_29640 [Actinoplanes ianthinogenes]|uniref:Heavy metal-binding domain-containing protein n=1 Tax=Actinoplanes ianthinogenes TaxID=122358 RepID=A0ABM7LLE0_9ACTN|nr:heavy metal-binding domain-containing protein [Actinoplanes ianthinogenes]BCJ40106.1 hypothetical protein Aiant_07630 [Actinoplanes ianthinogenes]GGR10311.1 hypothetical protein GCM10010168_29640 [Actinoplanes ianthinogenes]